MGAEPSTGTLIAEIRKAREGNQKTVERVNEIEPRGHPPMWPFFDLIWLNGAALRALSLTERRRFRREDTPKPDLSSYSPLGVSSDSEMVEIPLGETIAGAAMPVV
jgi:hypothetical protein